MGALLKKCVVRLGAAAVLLCLLLPSGCGDLLTGEGNSGRQNWAVIVGISNYQVPALNLKWADEDALDFNDALRRGNGWESERITLLTNGSATKEAITSAIAGLAKRVSTDDYVVFYFSGRGSYGPDQAPLDEVDGLDEYLVPYDGQQNSTSRDVSDDELEALFTALPTNNVLMILDTGFAGGATRSGTPSGKEKCVLRSGSSGSSGSAISPRTVDGMSHDLTRPGFMFMSAAQNGMAPSESSQLRNGVFTHYLVEALRRDTSGNRDISAQEVFEYAAPRTSAFEAGQSPQLIDNRGKRFGLVSF